MSHRLKLLTFNVCHDYPEQRYALWRRRLLVDALAAEAADVVLLQEVFISRAHGDWMRGLVDDLRQKGLHYELFYAAANGSFAENGEFEEGSAILSRHPIRDAEARVLAPWHEVRRRWDDYEYVERRIALRATIAVEGAELDVFGAHVTDFPSAGHEPSARRIQIEDLRSFVASRRMHAVPALVGGDLNAEPDTDDIRWLCEQGFLDLCGHLPTVRTSDSRGRDFESPRDESDRQIDYLFVADAPERGVLIHDARVVLGAPAEVEPGRFLWASDHNGLLADVTLSEPR